MARLMTEQVRKRDRETIYLTFITPEERKQRALAAGKLRNLESISKIAKAMGVNWSTCNAILERENVSIRSLMRLARALGVSMAYLTEREV